MGTYKPRDNDAGSEYADNDGDIFTIEENSITYASPKCGSYDKMRPLISANKPKLAVLDAISIECDNLQESQSYIQARRKYDFFKTIYPESTVELFEFATQYKLIQPFIEGDDLDNAVRNLTFAPTSEKLEFLLSVTNAIADAHNKGFCIIDIKSDNLIYNSVTKKTNLIDGGLAVNTGEYLSDIFKCDYLTHITENRTQYFHIAPECWSTKNVSATTAMDVYSIGAIFSQLQLALNFSHYEPFIDITERCLNPNYNQRPTMTELNDQLLSLLSTEIENENIDRLTDRTFLDEINSARTVTSISGTNTTNQTPVFDVQVQENHFAKQYKPFPFIGSETDFTDNDTTPINLPLNDLNDLSPFSKLSMFNSLDSDEKPTQSLHATLHTPDYKTPEKSRA